MIPMDKLLFLFAIPVALLAQRVVEPGNAAKAPSDAIVLFDGSNLDGWTNKAGGPAGCKATNGELHCSSGAGDIYTKYKFKDVQMHIEFAPPLMDGQKGQLRGNSGVYIHGLYEIQILDSFNNPTYATGMAAALYGQAPPLVNAARPPEQWQVYDIIFHAPRCGADGKLIAQGTVTVLWNNVLAQDQTPILESAKSCEADRAGEAGALMLQDHSGFKGAPHTTMRFRNLWIRPIR